MRLELPADYIAIAHAGYSRSEDEYSLLGALGASMTRVDFRWDAIEAQPGVFDFSGYDAFVNSALSNGIDVLAILDYDVPWIHSDGQLHNYIPPDRMQDWLNYVAKVVERYAGKVKAYEIWNEPNGPFWTGSINEFTSLTRQTAEVIRLHDPSALIVGGAFFRTPNDWARTMIAGGAFQQVDAISFHPYASTAENASQISIDFMAYVRSLGFMGEFWITEVGFTSEGIYPWTLSQDQYPAQLIKTITLLSISGAEKLVWYTLTCQYLSDQAPFGETPLSIAEAYFGVAYPDYSPKNGAYAYQALSESLQGSTYAPDLIVNFSDRDWIRVFPYIREDGRLAVVAWSDFPARLVFSAAVTGTIANIDGPGESRFSGQYIRLSAEPLVLVTDAVVDSSTDGQLQLYKAAF